MAESRRGPCVAVFRPLFWSSPRLVRVVLVALAVEIIGPAALADTPPPGLVPCPLCDEDGRMECPRCDGHGKLQKDCPRCGGTGERECPQCSKHELEGTVPCGYCSGKGSIGKRGEKTCPQCAGSGERDCPTCRGQGHLTCRETVYAGICSLCRFARRVRCVVCDGERFITREERRQAAAKRQSARDGTAPPRESFDASSRVERAPAEADADVSLSLDALEGRLAAVGEERISSAEFDIAELRRQSEAHVKAARTFDRALEGVGAERPDLTDRISSVQGRLRLLRTRLLESAEHIEALERTYARCERRWVARPVGTLAQKRYRDWASDMDSSLNSAESRAERLSEEAPLSLVALASELDEEIATLRVLVDEEIAEISAERARREEELAAEKAQKRAKDENPKEESARRRSTSSRKTSEETSEPGEESSGEPRMAGAVVRWLAVLASVVGVAVFGWRRTVTARSSAFSE